MIDIRNSIVGTQNINWSAHIYPLVAALNEAGFEGEGYDVAHEKAVTLIQQRNELALALDLIYRHYVLESVDPDPDRWDKIHPQFKAARSYLSPAKSNPSEPQGKAADLKTEGES